MVVVNRTFRIFVSSTFSDLKEERNALQKNVFPKLRELCMQHGFRFQAIDLRWGVSEEASLDQQTMNICLDEISRCQKTTPRPNFIVLLGDRYGWIPPPAQIPESEFQQILGVVERVDRELLEEWYILDENAVPPEWQLKPREKSSPYEKYDAWQPVETKLRHILATATVELQFTANQLLPYTASATEQEIVAGALFIKDASEHVQCFFRSIEGFPAQFDLATRDFQDLDEIKRVVDYEAHIKLEDLKRRLEAHVPNNVHTYQVHWLGNGITTDHIDRLCQDVYSSISRIIISEIEQPHEIAPVEMKTLHIQTHKGLDDEGRCHHKFVEERLRFFVGRTQMLAKIEEYLNINGRNILAIFGAGGTGKSALIAKAVQQTQDLHPQAKIVYRFIGVTPGSSDGGSFLGSLCREISHHYGVDKADIPMDYRDLVPELSKRMKFASAEKPLVLFLDSLDQLSFNHGTRGLIWLPSQLPEHVSVVVSSRPEEDIVSALKAKQASGTMLNGLTHLEGEMLLSQWLESVQRKLQPTQQYEVMDKFEISDRNPLYLKLAFEEARLWKSYQYPEVLAIGVPGIIRDNMINRLKHESNHGEMLVSHALGYLSASRYGLAEDELVDLLSRDLQVYEWFFRQTFHLPIDLVQQAIDYLGKLSGEVNQGEGESSQDKEKAALTWLKQDNNPTKTVMNFLNEALLGRDGPRLPIILWSRLYHDMAPYITERLVDGSSLMYFYHRELGDISKSIFLTNDFAKAYHEKLSEYFRFKADPVGDRSWTGQNVHGLSELPYHLTKAGKRDEVFHTLTDFRFLEHKAKEVGITWREDENGKIQIISDGVRQIQEDLKYALEILNDESGEIRDFERAPLIITAKMAGAQLTVFCPVCKKTSPVGKEMLNKIITCPKESCRSPLKLNAFVIQTA